MTAANVLDVIQECAGQASDAVPVYAQAKMENAPQLSENFRNRNVPLFNSITMSSMAAEKSRTRCSSREAGVRSRIKQDCWANTVRIGLDRERMEESLAVEVSLCSSTTRTPAICLRGRRQDGREEKQSTTHVEKIDETS